VDLFNSLLHDLSSLKVFIKGLSQNATTTQIRSLVGPMGIMWGILIEKNYVFVVSKGISVTTIVITMLIAIDIFDI